MLECCSGWNAERQWRRAVPVVLLVSVPCCSGWNAERQWRPFTILQFYGFAVGCSGWNAERQWRLPSREQLRGAIRVAAVGTPKGNGDTPPDMLAEFVGGVAAVGTPKGNGDDCVGDFVLDRENFCSGWNAERQWRDSGDVSRRFSLLVAAVGTPKGNGEESGLPRVRNGLSSCSGWSAERQWRARRCYEVSPVRVWLQRLERRKAMERSLTNKPCC